MPTLSVFMTNFNHAAELPRALDAIFAQSRPADQVVVVDDGSTDDSWAVLESFADRHPALKLLRHDQNQGVVAGVATALSACTGDYVYGAGADDQVLPGWFETVIAQAELHPGAGVIFGDVVAAYDDHRGDELQSIPQWVGRAPVYITPDRFRDEHLAVDPAGFSLGAGTVYRRDALQDAGGFRAALGSWCDTFAGRILALRHGAVYTGQPAARWTVHTASYSHRHSTDDDTMARIGREAACLMRTEFSELFEENAVRRFEVRWMLEMSGGYERVVDTLLPRRLRDVRRAYAELSRDGRWFDRLLGGLLRVMFRAKDRRQKTAAQRSAQARLEALKIETGVERAKPRANPAIDPWAAS